MDAAFVLAVGLALAYAATNGLHDASNAIAALVSTRAARPLQAALLAAVFNLLGPLVLGAAVADTVDGIVTIEGPAALGGTAAGLASAVVWNLATWARGLPASSRHALVGGLVGAGVAAGGTAAIRWGGLDGLHPVEVIGTPIALAVSPLLVRSPGWSRSAGCAARAVARAVARRRHGPVRGASWAAAASLAFGHGSNDAQKSVGVIAALLVADGRAGALQPRAWAAVARAAALTAGTTTGGWRIVRTIGRRIVGPSSARRRRRSGRVGGGDRRRVRPRRPGLDDAGRRLLDRRRRRRAPPLASCPLARRAWDRARVGHDAAGDRRARGRAGALRRGADMRRWLLPAEPDVLGMLGDQIDVTIAGVDAFVAWAGGDTEAEARVRAEEHRADAVKRDLHRVLRTAFVTPLEPEDLFALSRGIDRILNMAKDAVRESEVMDCRPDAPMAAMATLIAAAVRELGRAVASLAPGVSGTTAAAEQAIKEARRIERVYRAAVGNLLGVDDLREVMARQELYRRGSGIGEAVVDVAERVLYAAVKEG